MPSSTKSTLVTCMEKESINKSFKQAGISISPGGTEDIKRYIVAYQMGCGTNVGKSRRIKCFYKYLSKGYPKIILSRRGTYLSRCCMLLLL